MKIEFMFPRETRQVTFGVTRLDCDSKATINISGLTSLLAGDLSVEWLNQAGY